jgi:hypothetical protein
VQDRRDRDQAQQRRDDSARAHNDCVPVR